MRSIKLMKNSYLIKFFYTSIFFFFLYHNSYAYKEKYSYYGLNFYSNPTSELQTSSLKLERPITIRSGDSVKLKFDLLFNKKFTPGALLEIKFGQKKIVQLLTQNKSRFTPNQLVIISGSNSLMHEYQNSIQWSTLTLIINAKDNVLILKVEGQSYQLPLSQIIPSEMSFTFGRLNTNTLNSSTYFRLKNINLSTNGKTYFWPLDNSSGSVIKDQNHGKKIIITNPQWLVNDRYRWRKIDSYLLDSFLGMAYNQKINTIELADKSKLLVFNLNRFISRKLDYVFPVRNSRYNRYTVSTNGTRLWYDVGRSYFIPMQFIKDTIIPSYSSFARKNRYSKHCGVFSAANSFWLFGGFGQGTYSNSFYNFSVTNNKRKIFFSGDTIEPRYFSSITHMDNKLFIYGGLGEEEKKHHVDRKYYHDLFEVDLDTRTIKEIGDFNGKTNSLLPVPRLYMDSTKSKFKTLLIDTKRIHTALALYEFDNTKKTVTCLSDTIPYVFHDIHSHANLFFSELNKQWFAVTVHDNKEVAIYLLEENVLSAKEKELYLTENDSLNYLWLVLIMVLVILGITLLTLLLKNKKKGKPISQLNSYEEFLTPIKKNNDKIKFPIRLLGGATFYDENSGTIEASPMITELFLFIYLHSIHGKTGVTSKKIDETIWGGTDRSIQNKRRVGIKRLRDFLDQTDTIQLEFNKTYWRINSGNKIISDYEYISEKLITKTYSDEEINQLLELFNNGVFLEEFQNDWLDDIKDNFAIKVIEELILFVENKSDIDISTKNQLLDVVLIYEDTNEYAFKEKCKLLEINFGRQSAIEFYKKFVKNYEEVYGEEYFLKIKDILSK